MRMFKSFVGKARLEKASTHSPTLHHFGGGGEVLPPPPSPPCTATVHPQTYRQDAALNKES